MNTSSNQPELLTVGEAAAALRISRNSAYELVRQHRLPHIRLGRTVRIPRRLLEEWIAREAGIALPSPAVVSWASEVTDHPGPDGVSALRQRSF